MYTRIRIYIIIFSFLLLFKSKLKQYYVGNDSTQNKNNLRCLININLQNKTQNCNQLLYLIINWYLIIDNW